MRFVVVALKTMGVLFAAAVLLGCWVLYQRSSRIEAVRRFCSGIEIGSEREQVLSRVRKEELIVTKGEERDVVSIEGWMVLTWCIVHHVDGKVTSREHQVE